MGVTKTGRQRVAESRQRKPYQPSERDLQIYLACCRHERLREIGKRFGLCHSRVIAIRDRVGAHRAQELVNETDSLRAQHTASLEHVAAEALSAWKSIKDQTLKSADGSAPSVGVLTGSPGANYLMTVITSIGEMRKIWSVDKQPERHRLQSHNARDDGSHGLRVAGKSREQVLLELIQKLQTKLSAAQNGPVDRDHVDGSQ